jgi:hypothetical protein
MINIKYSIKKTRRGRGGRFGVKKFFQKIHLTINKKPHPLR